MSPSEAIEEAREALKPFAADAAETGDGIPDDATYALTDYPNLGVCDFTLGDLRRASRALAALNEVAVVPEPSALSMRLRDHVERLAAALGDEELIEACKAAMLKEKDDMIAVYGRDAGMFDMPAVYARAALQALRGKV